MGECNTPRSDLVLAGWLAASSVRPAATWGRPTVAATQFLPGRVSSIISPARLLPALPKSRSCQFASPGPPPPPRGLHIGLHRGLDTLYPYHTTAHHLPVLIKLLLRPLLSSLLGPAALPSSTSLSCPAQGASFLAPEASSTRATKKQNNHRPATRIEPPVDPNTQQQQRHRQALTNTDLT